MRILKIDYVNSKSIHQQKMNSTFNSNALESKANNSKILLHHVKKNQLSNLTLTHRMGFSWFPLGIQQEPVTI